MRTFFCIELEEALKVQLDAITQSLRRKTQAKVGWVRKENLHITLKFLGEINTTSVEDLKKAAEAALDGLTCFELTLDKLGVFPDLRKPRVIWIGSTQVPEAALELHAALEERLTRLGFAPEDHKYTPHITLGRVKEISKSEAEQLAQQMQTIAFSYTAKAEGITLMESRLTPSGSIYTPLFRLKFAREYGF